MASLPTSLCASYITYKADTNQVVSWLAETGLKCGYSLKQTPQSRSNGRKRPQTRNENHSTKSVNTIPTHLFVPLAQHISQARRKVAELPRVVALSLDRAIRMRKEFVTVYKIQQPQVQVLGSDEVDGHVHFVNILEKVEQVSSSFAATIPDVPTFAKEASIEIKYEAEIVDDYEEAFFAACCLIDDMNEVRQFLRRTRKAYSWQNTDIGSASVATDNAIALVRQTIEDFALRFPKHDLTVFVEEIFVNQSRANNLSTDLTLHDPPFDFTASQSADTSFLWIKSLWTSYAKNRKATASTEYQQSPSRHHATPMTSEERYIEEKEFLAGFLPDYCSFASKLSALHELIPVHDTITFGLWQLSQHEGDIPFWLLFGLQVFLDVREEAQSQRGFEDLVYSAKTVLIEADLHRKLEDHHSIQGIPNWTPEYLTSVNQMTSCTKRLMSQDVISFILDNKSSSLKDLSQIPAKNSDDATAFSFLRNHPLLCGLLVFWIECSMLKLGLELANTIPLIMSSAHLYNALLKTDYLGEEWPDMELLITHQDDKHLFFGGRPLTILDCTKKLDLISGVSAMEYARNSRVTSNYKTKLNNKNRRKLGTTTMPLSQVLSDIYCDPELQPLNPALVMKALGVTGKDRGFDIKTKPVDWLKLLLNQVHEEFPKRKFSYFALNRKCHEVLSVIPGVLKQEKSPWLGDLKEFFQMSGSMIDPVGLPPAVFKVVSSVVPIDKRKTKCTCCGKNLYDQRAIEEHALGQRSTLNMLASAIRGELHADDDDCGVMTSAVGSKLLADSLQRGGPPSTRIELKTTLLMHTSSNTALDDIDAFYNNRGGDFLLKQRAPGARYNKRQAVAGLSDASVNRSTGVTDQIAQSSRTQPPMSMVNPAMPLGTQRALSAATPAISTPAKKPMGIAEFMKTLPPLKEPLVHVDMKAMCRELMEDGVLDALEQAMLMKTGK